MSESTSKLLRDIRHCQDGLERAIERRSESKIRHYIDKLNRLPITVSHLEATGVGRTVNSLRKQDGIIGEVSRNLVSKWKEMVVQLENADAAASAADPQENGRAEVRNGDGQREVSSDSGNEVDIDEGCSNASDNDKLEPEPSPIEAQDTKYSAEVNDKDKRHRDNKESSSSRKRHGDGSSKHRQREENHKSHRDSRESVPNNEANHRESKKRHRDSSESCDDDRKHKKHSKDKSRHSKEDKHSSDKHRKDKDDGKRHRSSEGHSSKREDEDKKNHKRKSEHSQKEESKHSGKSKHEDPKEKKRSETSEHTHKGERHSRSHRKEADLSSDEKEERQSKKSGQRHSKSRHLSSGEDDMPEKEESRSKKSEAVKRSHKSDKRSKSYRRETDCSEEEGEEEAPNKSKESSHKNGKHSRSRHRDRDSNSSDEVEVVREADEKRSSSHKTSHKDKDRHRDKKKHKRKNESDFDSDEPKAKKQREHHKAEEDPSDSDSDVPKPMKHKEHHKSKRSEEKPSERQKESKFEHYKSKDSSEIKSKGVDKHKKSSKSENKKNKTESAARRVAIQEIQSGSGTSFADALGMCESVVRRTSSKKKQMQPTSPEQAGPSSSVDYKDRYSGSKMKLAASVSSCESEDDSSEVPNLLKQPVPAPEPLDLNISSLLPTITPNYRPLGNQTLESFQKRTLTEEEALSRVINAKNQRTKVYSGVKIVGGKVPTLFDLCTRVLQDNIDALEYTGGVPYHILKPVLERCNPDQLQMLEHYNPYLMEDTGELWKLHCMKEFRNKSREENETWSEMYSRCLEEREAKLRALTANIKQAQVMATPVRSTKLAYVESYVKPPRNVMRAQAKNNTGHEKKPAMTPSARLASIATAPPPGAAEGGAKEVVPSPRQRGTSERSSQSSAKMKPKKAPLMAKTLAFLKSRFRR